jgi:Transglycosylase SLT domain
MTKSSLSLFAILLLLACGINSLGQRKVTRKKPAPAASTPLADESPKPSGELIGKRIVFVDGTTIDVDDTWKQGGNVWYRLHGLSRSVDREVKKVEDRYKEAAANTKPVVAPASSASVDTRNQPPTPAPTPIVWIYLKDGARMRVDEVREVADGAWYNRRNVSIFVDRERIARIERELPGTARDDWNSTGWSSGNPAIDQLITKNSTRFGIDPYLVFLVIEQESHFRTRAVSPKGAQGLMQLMPGTARRFGVKRPFDPVENIRGGTQYLKELLSMFNNRVDLALASYNAGEGRVLNYGNRVPPFKETREYVRRISARYGKKKGAEKESAPASSKRN